MIEREGEKERKEGGKGRIDREGGWGEEEKGN